jgi:hypothetical protein
VSTPAIPHGIEVGGSPTASTFVDQRAIPDTLATTSTTTATTQSVPLPYADALESLAMIEATYEGIEIMAAMPNQGYDDTGALIDTMDVSYRIIGRPGVFTVTVPYALNWNAIAFFQIGLQANTIELIYEGAGSLNETPTVFLTQPPPTSPPVLIPVPGTLTPV